MDEQNDSLLAKVDAVLDEVMDLLEENRIPRIERICKDDHIVRDKAIAILKSAASAPAFLNNNVFEFATSLLRDFAGDDIETHIPGIEAYEIIEEIARGGMGVVYKARDIYLDRIVAIKILEEGIQDRLRSRFQLEQHILSRLEHANIARLYGVGFTDDERPYFAMEYIDGAHIDDYCDEHTLSIEERIEKFIEVAKAVSFAHDNTIIHRDIKPSNILVSSKESKAKLVDFGIARLIQEDNQTQRLTATNDKLFTPNYAAPEQISSEPTTVTTDVYQLGVVLYKLLTGHLPYPAQGLGIFEIGEFIKTHDPTRPSEVIFTKEKTENEAITIETVSKSRGEPIDKLSKTLRGDLDAIVMKAIRKEPHLRYRSVDALIEDIQNYRTNLPVKARSESFSYGLKKYVRRHKFGIAVSALLLTLLTTFGVIWLNQQIKVNREERRAYLANEYVLDLIRRVNPMRVQGKSITPRNLIYPGITGLDSLRDEPVLQAGIMLKLGELSYHIALPKLADSLLHSTLPIYRNEYGPNHPLVAETMHWLGMVLLDLDETEEAKPYLENALEMRESVLEKTDAALLQSRSALADVYMRSGQLEDAEKLLIRNLEARSISSLSFHHEIFSSIDGIARIRFVQALQEQDSTQQRMRYSESEQGFREALRLRELHLGPMDLRTAHTQYGLAGLLVNQSREAEATSYYRKALEVYQHVLRDSSDLIALAQLGLAGALDQTKNYQEAEYYYLASTKMFEKSLGLDHYQSAYPWIKLGALYIQQTKWQKAIEALRQNVTILDRLENKDNPYFAYLHYGKGLLGLALLESGDSINAEKYLRESVLALENHEAYRLRISKHLLRLDKSSV